jgi:hypothetical protein
MLLIPKLWRVMESSACGADVISAKAACLSLAMEMFDQCAISSPHGPDIGG